MRTGFVLPLIVAAGSCTASASELGGDRSDVGVDGAEASAECACPTSGQRTAVHPLACASGYTPDPPSLADFDAQEVCSQGGTVLRVAGCGLVSFATEGYVGGSATFNEQSQDLVGFYSYSDIPFGRCAASGVSAYQYGQLGPSMSSCPQITSCVVCGMFSGGRPLCGDIDGGVDQ